MRPRGVYYFSYESSVIAGLGAVLPGAVCACSVTESCPTLCDPMNYSPPDSSVLGISQARILEVSIIFPREGNGNPLQYFCLENPMDGGAWEAVVRGVAKRWSRLSDFTFTFSLGSSRSRD